ncbi:MAG: DUF2029 domain-containing protein [Gemmataceae bacterium]|nr:DUF2029 domain-containing protein [Gemmataceae bacterium]
MKPAWLQRQSLPTTVRSAVLVVLVVALIWWQRDLLFNPAALKVEDFGCFWAGAVLNRSGGNPYSLEEQLPLQRAIDPELPDAIMPWPPPWFLALVQPFGWLSFPTARWLWGAMEVVLLAVGASMIWDLYGGARDKRWLSWLIAFTYYPCLQSLGLGQTPPIVLAGFVGFLWFLKQDRAILAGVFAGVTAIKPQMAFLFWLALLVWSVDRRRWSTFLAATATVLALLAFVSVINPPVMQQYLIAWKERPPREGISPTFGSLLRVLIGTQYFWLQFVPMMVGIAWLAWEYRRHRASWDWTRRMPLLLCVTYLSAPYGWAYDLTIWLVPILHVTIGLVDRRRTVQVCALLFHGAVNGTALAMNVMERSEYEFWWMAPTLFAAYVLLRPRAMGEYPAEPGASATGVL